MFLSIFNAVIVQPGRRYSTNNECLILACDNQVNLINSSDRVVTALFRETIFFVSACFRGTVQMQTITGYMGIFKHKSLCKNSWSLMPLIYLIQLRQVVSSQVRNGKRFNFVSKLLLKKFCCYCKLRLHSVNSNIKIQTKN